MVTWNKLLNILALCMSAKFHTCIVNCTGVRCACRAVVGEIDEDVEKRLDFSNVKAEPLNAILH